MATDAGVETLTGTYKLFRPIGVCAVVILLCLARTPSSGDAASETRSRAADLEAITQHQEALSTWSRVLLGSNSQSSDYVAALLATGRVYYALGDDISAEKQFRSLLASCAGFQSECSQAYMGLGKIAEEESKYSESLAYYSEVLQRSCYKGPLCSEAKLRRAACYAALGKGPEQLEELSGLLKDYPEQHDRVAEARTRIAQIELAKGSIDKALAELDQILEDCRELDLWCVEAKLWQGAAQRQSGKIPAALATYGAVIKDFRAARAQRLKAIVSRASILEQTGQRVRAIGEYAAILLQYPEFQAQSDYARERMVSLLSQGRTPTTTVRFAKRTIAGYDKRASDDVLDGESQELGRKSGADPAYARLVQESAETMLKAGRGFRELGQFDEAVEKFRSLRREYPEARAECYEAAWDCARILASRNGYGAAIAEFDDLAAQNTSYTLWYARALNAKASLQFNSRRYRESAATFRRLLSLNPQWRTYKARTDAKMLLARALLNDGRNQEALAEFHAMSSEPRWPRSDKGLICKYTGITSQSSVEAEKWFTKTITEFPDLQSTGECYLRRAVLRCGRRAFAQAIDDVLLIGPIAQRHFAMGEYYKAQGKKKEASAEFDQVVPGLPESFGGSCLQAYQTCDTLIQFFNGVGGKKNAAELVVKKKEIYRDHLAPLP
jgi:tetratricopeptide (TPR) repeat protein